MKLLSRMNLAAFGAELLGAWTLVTMFLILTNTTAVSYFIATSVALAMASVYVVFSSISGAHANPAVTFGFWTARQVSTARAAFYIVAQVLGGLSAWGLYTFLTDRAIPKAASTNFDWRVFTAEAVGAGVFCLVFAANVLRRNDVLSSAFALGTALFVGVMIAGTASRGLLNPAAALGVERFHFDWAYILGPMVGGMVGVNLYNGLFAGSSWMLPANRATVTTTKTTTRAKTTRRRK